MKILVNASNLVIGGAIQVACNLMLEWSRNPYGHTLKYVISPQIAKVLPGHINAIVLSHSPAKLFYGCSARNQLDFIEKEFNPDIVLTIFGPSYWRPKAIHVCGFANPWVFTANDYAWKSRAVIDRLTARIKHILQKICLKNIGINYFIVETKTLADAILRVFPSKGAFVIPNNYGSSFLECKSATDWRMPSKLPDEYRIVTLSAYYSHKNLELIPQIAYLLAKLNLPVRPIFYLSLPKYSMGWQRVYRSSKNLNILDLVRTVGPVRPVDAPEFYRAADAMLLPSVLEVFSANYPEAMISGIPIITTELPFAQEVCLDSALYFTPMDAKSAADRITELILNPDLRDILVKRGYRRVQSFPTPEVKAQKYLEACQIAFNLHGSNSPQLAAIRMTQSSS